MFKPFNRIKSIPGHKFEPAWSGIYGDLVPHEYILPDNWYASFATASDDESRAAFLVQWTTPAQREHNSTHTTCPRCKGRGCVRDDGNIGCEVCKGTGGIKNDRAK